jgi:hypothetical protein
VLIGRYLIQPYFAAVFLEAYLAAFFRLNVTKQLQSRTPTVGKPVRSKFSNNFDEVPTVSASNFYQLWLIKIFKPTLEDMHTPPLWISETRSEGFAVLHFSLADGWKKFTAYFLGGSIFLYNVDDSLCRVAMLRGSKICVVKTSQLESEGIHGLGTKSQYLIIRIDQSLTGRSVLGGNRYHWWQVTSSLYSAFWDSAFNGPWNGPVNRRRVYRSKWLSQGRNKPSADLEDVRAILSERTWFLCSTDAEGLEDLLSKVESESRFEPPPAVKLARDELLIERGLQAKVEETAPPDSIFIFRGFLRDIIMSSTFELFIAALIVFSVGAKALVCFKPSKMRRYVIASGEYLFQFCFATEALLRITVHRLQNYAMDPWCCFDWLLVMSFSVNEIITASGIEPPAGPAMVTRMQRLVKVCRVLSILRLGRLSNIANIVNFLGASFPRSLGIFAIFLLVIIFSFSVVGTNVFGQLCTDQDQAIFDPAKALKATRCLMIRNPLQIYESFASVEVGILTLMRVFTGNDWISMMQKCSVLVTSFSRDDSALSDALSLLRKWNASSYEKDREQFMFQVQEKLPGCQSDDELEYLRKERLVDCSSGTDIPFNVACISNCGNWFAQIYFPLFFFISASIIFNLVMSSLYEGLKTNKSKARSALTEKRALIRRPIIKVLKCYRLAPLYQTWLANSYRKLRNTAMRRRYGFISLTRIRYRAAVMCLQQWYSPVFLRKIMGTILSRRNRSCAENCFLSWKNSYESKLPVRPLHLESDPDIELISSDIIVGDPSDQHEDTEYVEPSSDPDEVLTRTLDASVSEREVMESVNNDERAQIVFQSSLESATLSRNFRQNTPDYVIEASFAFQPSPPPGNRSSAASDAAQSHASSHALQYSSSSHSPDEPDGFGKTRQRARLRSQRRSKAEPDVLAPPALHGSYSGGTGEEEISFSANKDDGVHSDSTRKGDEEFSYAARKGDARPLRNGSAGQRQGMAASSMAAKVVPSQDSPAVRRDKSKGVAAVVAESGLDPVDKLHVMRRGLAVRPRNVPLLRHYGELLVAAGEVKEAEAVFQRALEIDPRDAGTLRAYLGLARAGGDEQAAAVLEDLLRRAEAVTRLDSAGWQPTSKAQAEAILMGRAGGGHREPAGQVRGKSEPPPAVPPARQRRRRHL